MTVRSKKLRLDQLLVDRSLAETKTKAQALIMAGSVRVVGRENLKPGMLLPPEAAIEVVQPSRWVGRGGDKLEAALADFSLDRISGAWLDSGASTGGFTDVLLAHGASRVYAVDVGYGQLAVKLRDDPRVVVMDRCNLRTLDLALIPERLNGVTLDLSFISVRLVLDHLRPLLADGAMIVLLFKPQFEGSKKDVGKGGVIRDDSVRGRIIAEFESWCAAHRWIIRAQAPSRVAGRDGNREHFFLLS